MFQEGPVPDRLMAGIDPEEFFARDARSAGRGCCSVRREDMSGDGGWVFRPDAVRSFRLRVMIASREFEELTEMSGRRLRDCCRPGDCLIGMIVRVVGPGMDGRFRVTYFDADREPSNHTVYETKDEALNAALREGFVSRIAARGPEPENFAQGGPVRGGIGGLSDVARGMFRA
jgi:hypothetical protein